MENKVSEEIDSSDLPVIVIGSGMGGLGAACRLALAGEKVLILEKHNVPGGFATSFIRGRFEFEGAMHVLASVGTKENPGTLYAFLDALDIFKKIEFKRPKELFRAIFYDGYDVTLPSDKEKFFNMLKELFPSEKKGIEKFKTIGEKVWDGFMFVAQSEGGVSPIKILMKHPYLVRMGGLTLEDLLNRCVKDPRLRMLIGQVWGYDGLPPSKLNVVYYLLTLIGILEDVVYPVGRSHALTNALVESVEKTGGKIIYNSLVNRILLKEGRVSGVELLDGQRIPCKAVISNVNPICTTQKMLPKENVSEKYLRRIYAPKVGNSGFTVYMGLNKTPEKLGMSDYEIFLNATDNFDEQFQSMNRIGKPLHAVAGCYNNIYDKMSPPGTSIFGITTLQFGRNWATLSPYQYHKVKDKMTNDLIDMIEETFVPDLRDHLEVVESATPLTYYHYAKTMEGAIYGYVNDVYNSPMVKMNSRGAVPGLYLAGAWVNLGGGLSTSFSSGIIAGGMYLSEKNKGGN